MTLLESLKAIDRPEALGLIIRDSDAKKILIAWTMASKPAFRDRPLTQGEAKDSTPPHIIRLAWSQIPWDALPFEEVSILASIPKSTTKLKIDQLRKAALIYPDGTANEKAMAIARSDVRAYLQGLTAAQKS